MANTYTLSLILLDKCQYSCILVAKTCLECNKSRVGSLSFGVYIHPDNAFAILVDIWLQIGGRKLTPVS